MGVVIWITGLIASTMWGITIGGATGGSQNVQLWAGIAGALSFVCLRLWYFEAKRK